MRDTMRNTGSYIVQSMLFAKQNVTFFFFFISIRTWTLFAQICYACISLTPLGMRYPPSTKSSCVIRPLPGRTGKNLLPERSKQRVLFSSTIRKKETLKKPLCHVGILHPTFPPNLCSVYLRVSLTSPLMRGRCWISSAVAAFSGPKILITSAWTCCCTSGCRANR